jgi:hypothetical protein
MTLMHKSYIFEEKNDIRFCFIRYISAPVVLPILFKCLLLLNAWSRELPNGKLDCRLEDLKTGL